MRRIVGHVLRQLRGPRDGQPAGGIGVSQQYIGRRPIFAFGSSDGDQQMLEWTGARTGAKFVALVHHTDGEREYAYDRTSHVGRLDKALDEATKGNWTVVDMKRDWARIFAFEPTN